MNTVEFSKAELKPTLSGLFLLIVLHFKLLAGYFTLQNLESLVYLSIYGLFNDAVSSSGYIALNGRKFSE
jgi:hypothetical protein